MFFEKGKSFMKILRTSFWPIFAIFKCLLKVWYDLYNDFDNLSMIFSIFWQKFYDDRFFLDESDESFVF